MRALLTAGILALLSPPPTRAEDSLSRWIEGTSAAVQALHDGDAARAEIEARAAGEACPAGESGARARLVLALALEASDRPDEAAAALQDAAGLLPPALREPALWRLAADLERTGRPADALAVLAEARTACASASPASRCVEQARGVEARALLASGRVHEAVRTAREAAASGDPPARLALGRALRAAGDPRGAEVLVALWTERGGEPEGEEAGRELETWSRAGPPPPGWPPSPAVRLDRAERLLAAARPRLAVAEIEVAESARGPDSRSRLLRAVALLQTARPAEAEAVARPVAAEPGEDGRAAEWVLARATARQGRHDEAAGWYRRVASARPTVPGLSTSQQADLPDEAAYLAAWLSYDAGRFEEAARALGRFAHSHPRARRAPEARWFRAWSLVRLGRRDEALQALRSLAGREPGTLRSASLYWQARLEPSPARSASLDRQAVAADADGWYGLLAAARLEAQGMAAPRPAVPAGPPPEIPRGAEAVALARATVLLAAGLRAEGLSELDRSGRGPGARGRAAAVAELAAFAGDPRIPYRMARDHLLPTRRAERWSFPEPHAGALVPAAAGMGVDPALALAVMRRESAFDASARSAAAAEGILQLRPETAERLAALLGLPGPRDGALSGPPLAIGLGVTYLALLASRFPDPPAVVAAYNAGPAAAAPWAAASAGTPLDEWVENLPYRETRQYVRGVMADWARYRRLRGEPPPPLDPDAPVRPPAEGVAF